MKYKKIAVIVILLLLGGYLLFNQTQTNNPQPQTSAQVQGEITRSLQVELSVNYGDIKSLESSSVEITEGDTVLAALQKSKNIETKEYSFGTSVESIEGVKSDADDRYWLYYVNGNQAQVGADQYVLKDGDKIEWKFEKGL